MCYPDFVGIWEFVTKYTKEEQDMKLSTTTGVIEKRFGYAEAIKMIAQAGFDAYDMDMIRLHVAETSISNDGYMDYVKNLKNIADENGIVCNQAHAPFPTQLNGNAQYNKRTFDMIIRSIECASLLGAKIIVVHPIKNSSSSLVKGASYEPFESRQQLYDENIRFFKNLIPYCEKFNIKIAVENMWERHPLHHDILIPAILGYAEEHSRFIKDVGSKWIVGCLDIGHSLICGEKPQDAIHFLGSDLKALHIHDCNGYEDSHTLPYSTNTDWSSILKALAGIKYEGDFTFEAHNFLANYPNELVPEALRYMCTIGRYMIKQIV